MRNVGVHRASADTVIIGGHAVGSSRKSGRLFVSSSVIREVLVIVICADTSGRGRRDLRMYFESVGIDKEEDDLEARALGLFCRSCGRVEPECGFYPLSSMAMTGDFVPLYDSWYECNDCRNGS